MAVATDQHRSPRAASQQSHPFWRQSVVQAGKSRDHRVMALHPHPFADGGLPPPGGHIVTSSILVRHFGLWGQRALHAPVTILQHNRPRHVLVSIDHWIALLAQTASGAASMAGADDMINAVSDLVIAADAAGVIAATSRTARAQFGTLIRCGQRLESILAANDYALVRDVLREGPAAGLEAVVRLPSLSPLGRMIGWTIVRYDDGVALIGRDDGAAIP
jgi:hypothetical protein